MLIKPIKTSAKLITEKSSIQSLPQFPFCTSLGICGRQFSVFAKSILDKYAKVLNYQFDYASLVFLEQAAGGGEQQNKEINNTIVVTWKLLSFLLNHETRQKQFLYQNPVLLKQMMQRLEVNLSVIRENDRKIYQDMMKCYRVYEKEMESSFFAIKEEQKEKETKNIVSVEENSVDTYSEVVDYVERQIQLYENKRQTEALIKKEKTKTEPFLAPFIMSRSFFVNLNHLMNENKTVSYKKIWQQSVSQQLERHYLDLHMQRFAKEQDVIKKEEMVVNMFQEFGSEKIEAYLTKTNETMYEQFIHAMYMLAGSEEASLEQTYNITQNENRTGRLVTRNNETIEAVYLDRKAEGSKKTESFKTEEYAFSQRTLLFAEYKKKKNAVMDILEGSEEITRNIVLSKVEEYKELFYEYIRNNINQQEKEEQSQELEDSEIFTDYDLKVLLDTVDEKKDTEESKFLKQKLNLVAIKEVTESLLEENTALVQKERLQLVSDVLQQVSFSNPRVEEHEENKKTESNASEISEESKRLEQTEAVAQKIERKVQKKILVKLQNRSGKIQNESIRRILLSKTIGRKAGNKQREGTVKKEELSIYNIKQTFENGSLPERKLLYLALEHNIDKLIIEKNNQSEERQVLASLVQAKQKIIQTTDGAKKVAGDWRFLMTKQRGNEMIRALSDLQPDTRKVLEQLVQNSVREFRYDLNTKEEMQRLQQEVQIVHKTEKSVLDSKRTEYKVQTKHLENKLDGYKTDATGLENKQVGYKAEEKALEHEHTKYEIETKGSENKQSGYKIEEKMSDENQIIIERREERQILWEAWEAFFEKTEMKEFLIEQNKESSVQNITRKILSVRKNGENTFLNEQKKYINLIKNMKFSDIIHTFETGSMPERTLMYRVLSNTMASMENKKERGTRGSRTGISQEHISKIKEVMHYEIKELHNENEKWKFTLSEEKNHNIIETLFQLKKTEREWLEKSMVQEVRNFIIEKKIQIANTHIQEEKSVKVKKDFENVILHENNTKNVYKKLNFRYLYDKMKQKQLSETNVYERQETVFDRKEFSYIRSETQIADARKSYQMEQHLKRDVYLGMEDDIRSGLLTQKNNDFMLPPTEEKLSVENGKSTQSIVSEKIKFHEESVKLILNHAKEQNTIEKSTSKTTEVLQQERILRELEANLLDYKVELEDKNERLEIVEKQLQNQEKKLQVLNENQMSSSQKNLKPEEARQFMKHLKEEMKMEQLRRGKR